MADKITPTLTLAALEKEQAPDPFTFGVKSRIVRFPDPMDLDFEKTDDFVNDLRSGKPASKVLQRWLPEEDYEILREAKLSGRQVAALMKAVLEHYEMIAGSQGEEPTSGMS